MLADKNNEEEQEKQQGFAERLLKSRTILLAEGISKELAEKVSTKLLLLDQDDEEKPVKLYINSPGGDVDAGYAIFDMCRFINAPVTCVCAGLTASAAVIVLLAAPKERRVSLPNSRFLLHQPSMGVRGSTADIQIEANEILKMRDRINKLIADETGQDIEKVKKDTHRNFWMDPEEAVEYGLVEKVIKSKTEIED